MLKLEKIKEIISGVVYGSIDQRISQRDKLIYGFVGLIIAVAVQVAFAYWLIPESRPHTLQFTLAGKLIPNRALLNIVVIPFQLLGIFSLIYVIQGATKYPFGKDSFWHLETEKYVPFFIRARMFMWLPYVVVFIIGKGLEFYMNSTTNLDPKLFIFWSIVSIVSIIVVFFVAGRLKTFLEKFENAIIKHKIPLPSELELKNYRRSIRDEVFNIKEIGFVLIPFLLMKLNDVLNSDATWRGGGGSSGYTFPITAVWSSFVIYIPSGLITMVFGSLLYVYSRIGFALNNLEKLRATIFLFHPDGRAGLGEIGDFIFSFITKILLIISIFTFVAFLALQTEPTDPTFWSEWQSEWRKLMVGVTIIGDSFALLFFYPLIKMKGVIKRKKEKERWLLLDRIKQKEEVYLNKSLKSEEFQEIESTFNLIKHIDAVPEWGIDTRQWLPLLGRFLLTFNGLALQLTINYLKI